MSPDEFGLIVLSVGLIIMGYPIYFCIRAAFEDDGD